jgi:hypothetical protein
MKTYNMRSVPSAAATLWLWLMPMLPKKILMPQGAHMMYSVKAFFINLL